MSQTGTYAWDAEAKQLVRLGDDWAPTDRRVPVVGDAHYGGLRATDGTPVDSRTKHRRYMKEHGLILTGDATSTWDKAAKERAEPPKDRTRREDLGRAMYELQQRRGRR